MIWFMMIYGFVFTCDILLLDMWRSENCRGSSLDCDDPKLIALEDFISCLGEVVEGIPCYFTIVVRPSTLGWMYLNMQKMVVEFHQLPEHIWGSTRNTCFNVDLGKLDKAHSCLAGSKVPTFWPHFQRLVGCLKTLSGGEFGGNLVPYC